MIALLFHFQDWSEAVEGAKTFMRGVDMDMWRHTAKALDATHMICVPYETTITYRPNDSEIEYAEYASLAAALAAYPAAAVVYLEDSRIIPGSPAYIGAASDPAIPFTYLSDLVHPVGDAIYVVGPDYAGLSPKMFNLAAPNVLVTIKTTLNRPLWAVLAGALALQDRKVKAGLA